MNNKTPESKTAEKISGEFVYQLDQDAVVRLYRHDEIDGVAVPMVGCWNGLGSLSFISEYNDNQNWKPAIITARRARGIIRESFSQPERFYVEYSD